MQFIKIFDCIYNSVGLSINKAGYDNGFYISVYNQTTSSMKDYKTEAERDAAFDKIEKQLNPFIVEV